MEKKVNVFQPHDYGGKTIKYELFSKNYGTQKVHGTLARKT